MLNHWLRLIIRDLVAMQSSYHTRVRLRTQGVVVHRQAIVNLDSPDWSFGRGTSIGAFSFLCVGPDADDPHYNGGLYIGKNVYIGEWNNIRATGGVIRIGNDVMISQMVSILGSGHEMKPGMLIRKQPNARNRTGVTIGDDVWLGAGCVILPGVMVGKGAVVAAGAVVNENVPELAIYGGVPARLISTRNH